MCNNHLIYRELIIINCDYHTEELYERDVHADMYRSPCSDLYLLYVMTSSFTYFLYKVHIT